MLHSNYLALEIQSNYILFLRVKSSYLFDTNKIANEIARSKSANQDADHLYQTPTSIYVSVFVFSSFCFEVKWPRIVSESLLLLDW